MNALKKLLLLSIAISSMTTAYGQDFPGEEFSSDIPIDIEGSFEKDTEADRVEKLRKKLEKQNEDFVQKKIEDLRYESEQKMSDTLSDAFSGSARPVSSESESTVVAHQPKVDNKNSELKDFLIIPSYVMSNYTGQNYNIESDLGFEVNVEGRVYKNITVGISVGYDTVSAMDVASLNPYTYTMNSFGGLFRTLDISMLKAGINSKVYFGSKKFQPFIGGGVSMTRANLSFDRQNFYDTMYFGMMDGVSQVDTTFFSGSIMAVRWLILQILWG